MREAILYRRLLLLARALEEEREGEGAEGTANALSSLHDTNGSGGANLFTCETYRIAHAMPSSSSHHQQSPPRTERLLPLFPAPVLHLYHYLLRSITLIDAQQQAWGGGLEKRMAVFSRISSPIGPSSLELRFFLSVLGGGYQRLHCKMVFCGSSYAEGTSRPAGGVEGAVAGGGDGEAESRSSADSSDEWEANGCECRRGINAQQQQRRTCRSSTACKTAAKGRQQQQQKEVMGGSRLKPLWDRTGRVPSEAVLFEGGYGRVEVDIRPRANAAAYREAAMALRLPPSFPLELLHNVVMVASGACGWLAGETLGLLESYNGHAWTAAFDEAFAKEAAEGGAC